MSELKHTPGPWEYNGVTYITAGKEIIVDNIKPFSKHGIANAKLIAAAPDMYKAIQYAITALADTGGMIDAGELIEDVDKARKMLIKAIKPLL